MSSIPDAENFPDVDSYVKVKLYNELHDIMDKYRTRCQELHDQTIRLQKDLEASQRYIDTLEKPSHNCNGQTQLNGTATRGCWNCNNQPTQTGGVCPYRNEKQAFAFCCIYWQERSKNI